MAVVHVPGALRTLADGEAVLRLPGATVGEVLRALAERHPPLGARVLDAEGRVRRYVNVFLGEEDVRFLQGLDTPVGERDALSLVPAVAGGAGLEEAQILRYSRQILLREVGGAGQLRLLAGGFRVAGGGEAVRAAAAYLAAGGSGVQGETAAGQGVGFLASLAPDEVAAFSPDAAAPRGAGWLGEAPGAPPADAAPALVLGSHAGRPALGFRTAAGCADCLARATAALGPPPVHGPDALALGAVAALVGQRLLLGLGPDTGLLALEGAAGLVPVEGAPRCGRHP